VGKVNILETDKNSAYEILPVKNWHGPFSEELLSHVLAALEDGKVIVLEDLPFSLKPDETEFIKSVASRKSRRNISFEHRTKKISNVDLEDPEKARLEVMLDRFGNKALGLLMDLLPGYGPALERARCSFRPDEIKFRAYSPRQDDRRLHVDAFPSRPLHGRRILRLFTNIAGDGTERHWQVGRSTFHSFAQKFFPRLKPAFPGSAWLLERLGATQERRSLYDHYMLQLHDSAKLDVRFQAQSPKTDLFFKPGVSWFCFTDQVLHAALSGHSALEQTLYLPVGAMADPLKSPLRILEDISGRKLI
jgi:hypothetical protein